MKSISYDAVMSPGAREKIDSGKWRVIGLSVMDTSNGRMVANLKTVTKSDQSEYTSALFVALRDEICLLHIPVENEHLFRFKMNADSGLRVHRFRTPQCTYSDVR